MTRQKGEGSLFKDGRGLWTAKIELPTRDGERRRKVIRGKDKATVIRRMKETQKNLDRIGDLPTRDITVADWMNEWLTTIAVHKVRPKTMNTYEGLIRREIVPAIGAKKLDKLSARDVRSMTNGIIAKGLSPTTAMQVHRILAVALKQAEREGRVVRNAALLTDAPRKAAPVLTALNVEQGVKVLQAAASDPLGSLAAAILLTGARQGELLGLELDRVGESLELSWQLQRLTWQHGCGGDCNRKRGSDCKHRRLQAPTDWEHRHITGGLWWTRPKSKAGLRMIPLVEPLASILRRHLEVTADQPNPYGLVWHSPDGSPIEPRDESRWWHELLDRAEVPQVRLHDGRHTTVDLLYEAGVPEDLIQEIVGHSSRSMSRAYKSRGNDVRLRAALESVSRLLLTA